MEKATFYHAGCPICQAAENNLIDVLDRSRVDVEIVDLVAAKSRLEEAERLGVRSVPALVIGDATLHINHGADLSALR